MWLVRIEIETNVRNGEGRVNVDVTNVFGSTGQYKRSLLVLMFAVSTPEVIQGVVVTTIAIPNYCEAIQPTVLEEQS